jgi:hypothetical protein
MSHQLQFSSVAKICISGPSTLGLYVGVLSLNVKFSIDPSLLYISSCHFLSGTFSCVEGVYLFFFKKSVLNAEEGSFHAFDVLLYVYFYHLSVA